MNQWMMSLLVLAAGFSANAGELRTVIGPNPAFALPIDLFTCRQQMAGDMGQPKLTQPTVEYPAFKLQWTGQNPLRISYIEIAYKDASLQGGKYTCYISPSELAAMNPLFAAEIPGGNPTAVYEASCGLRCGPISFNADVQAAVLQGTATVYGAEYDSQGRATPVVSETPISIEKRF